MTRPRSPRRPAALVSAAALSCAALATLTPVAAVASTPADSGSLTPSRTPGVVTAAWTGRIAGANAASDCTKGVNDALNDHHAFTVVVPPDFPTGLSVTMTVSETAPAADSILTVKKGGTPLASSDNGGVGGSESYSAALAAGSFDAITCSFAGASTYTATVTLLTKAADTSSTIGGTSTTAGPSTYENTSLASVSGANFSGEPSIGVDWGTGDVFFQANLNTIRARFPAGPGAPTSLTDVSCVATTVTTLDPILFTDSTTGRVGTSQLLANPAGVNSITQFFDASTNPPGPQTTCMASNGGGEAAGPDHQTLGGGAFPKPLPTGVVPTTGYPRAFYYCSQTIASGAICARSDNGGTVFTNSGTLPYTSECGGLHGHIRVAPDGTAYLPNKACGGKQGFAVSSDAGRTWAVHTVPGSTAGATDPSVSADRAGTAFLGYVDGDAHPKIATTKDKGATFSTPVDVGQALGIQNAVFAEVIAGDPGRAAFAFLGTPTGGNRDQLGFGTDTTDSTGATRGPNYTGGTFHLYVATTVDGGQTYHTVDATPTDPVQRGSICTNGTTCSSSPNTRNLLDFNDITVDKTGHVLVGYADGCTDVPAKPATTTRPAQPRKDCPGSTAVADNGLTAVGTIARQVDGPLLFVTPAGEDPGTSVPEAPLVVGLPVAALGALVAVALVRSRRRRGLTA